MDNTILTIIATFLLIPGLVGVVVPLLPSLPYMFVVALIYGAIGRFAHLTGQEILILGGLAAASLTVDYLSGLLGAKYGGASSKSLAGGLVGLLIGLFLLPPIGSIIGLFLGIYLSEMYLRRSRQQAIRAATAGLLGSLAGIVINLVLALIFIGLFINFALN